MLLSLDGLCRPVSASGEDQSVLVGASLDQLLWVTLEWLAQSESLQFILPEAVPAGLGEHSYKNEASLYSRSNWQWGSFMRKLLAALLKLYFNTF